MSRMKQLFSLNLTRIALVLLILFLTDVAIKTGENKLLAEPAQIRLDTHEVDNIKGLRRQIKLSQGYKIVFLGDSIVYGSSVTPRQTIPFYLEQELRKKYPQRDIKVFNYGYKGYGISETFLMLNTLRNADVDMVIFGINSGWFNRKLVIEHTNAFKVEPDIYQKSRVSGLGVNLADSGEDPWNRRLSDFLADHWAMYRNRSALAAKILGKSMAEKMYENKLYIYDPITYEKDRIYWRDVHRPWHEKDFSKQTTGKHGWLNLYLSNPQVKFYQLIMDLVQEEGVTPLFYATPVNYDMFEKYKNLDRVTWDKNRAGLRELSRLRETNYIDFSEAVPGKYFADSVHMLASGNKYLAEKISSEIIRKGLIQ